MSFNSAIVGAGDYGQVFASYLVSAGICVKGFLDDNQSKHGTKISGLPVLGASGDWGILRALGIGAVYVPIGNNSRRIAIQRAARSAGFETPRFIAPGVSLPAETMLGEAVYVLPGVGVMPYVTLNEGAMISMSAQIAHHTCIGVGAFVSTGANIGARVDVGELAFVGIGATVMTGVRKLGRRCLVGAGAVVINDVEESDVVAGVPARVIRKAL